MSSGPDDEDRRRRERERMVDRDLRARGISDRLVLDAMVAVPRDRFVPEQHRRHALDDHPLPIGGGQTISQPYVVALMTEAALVGPADRVLEVGTGSGYGAAVLGRIAGEVWSVERRSDLAATAAAALEDAGASNVHVEHGDGTLGWPDAAPFDAILVTACGPRVPESLLSQLAEGGRLVMPVGERAGNQQLVRVVRRGGSYHEEDLGGVRFVPLLGDEGFADPPQAT